MTFVDIDTHGVSLHQERGKPRGMNPKRIQSQVSRWGPGLKNRLSNPDPNRNYWVAKAGKEIVGMCLALKGEKENTIQAIYVLPKYQGKHIGSSLFGKAIEWLGRNKNIVLGVVTYNQKAIAFYKKHGFIEHGERHDDAAKLPSGKVLPEIELILTRAND